MRAGKLRPMVNEHAFVCKWRCRDNLGALALIRYTVAAALPHTPLWVLGIDLGTTNSAVAELRWTPEAGLTQEARCVEVHQQTYEAPYTHVLVPSVVAIHDGRVIVGEGAKRLKARALERGANPATTSFHQWSLKRTGFPGHLWRKEY